MQDLPNLSKQHLHWNKITIILLISLSIFTSCSLPSIPSSNTQTPIPTAISTLPPQETLVTFRLTIGQPLPPGESLLLTLLDEVSGLALNPRSYVMVAEDATHYTVIIPFKIGAIIKYRYTRQGTSNIQEHLFDGSPVRYRLYHVEGPGIVEDIVCRWTDTQYAGATGRIAGQITDLASGEPIPNILISAGGSQAFTRADGSYLLEGLPPGTHNLVSFAIDGMYFSYQQGATVAADSTTPASFSLTRTKLIPIVFVVSVPETTPEEAPLRMAGSLFQLGNTFADLSGGVSSIASRMPTLSRLPDGNYAVTLNLPVGAYLEYKYTLGDGLWNAEHSGDGSLMIRSLIVPDTTLQITDTVANWGTQQIAPIRFDITVPSYTPTDDGVSIQINPGFGWLHPLPMWQTLDTQGRSIWRFILISPLDVLETIQYRICRADQCGIADDVTTQGTNPVGHLVNTGILPQTILYTVTNWAWFPSAAQQASIPNVQIIPHGADFIAGISLDPSYHPSWGANIGNGINMVNDLGANWLIVSPTWTYTHNLPIVFEILPSQDIMWPDLTNAISQANTLGLDVGLFPYPHFPVNPDQWWQEAARDFPWWVSWFDHYAQFILHHADISNQFGVDALILGGDWLAPALPSGKLSDSTASGVPEDAEYRWRTLIEQIRDRYQGTLIWSLSYPSGLDNPPSFIEDFDKIMIQWSAPLSSSNNPSVSEMHNETSRLLDQDILPFVQTFQKPIILGLEYPSADGSSTGCISINTSECIAADIFSTNFSGTYEADLDLQEQADIYNAIFLAVNDREWISGVISMGYYPPVPMQNPSLSVYSKPAAGVLWYWFPRLLGNNP